MELEILLIRYQIGLEVVQDFVLWGQSVLASSKSWSCQISNSNDILENSVVPQCTSPSNFLSRRGTGVAGLTRIMVSLVMASLTSVVCMCYAWCLHHLIVWAEASSVLGTVPVGCSIRASWNRFP